MNLLILTLRVCAVHPVRWPDIRDNAMIAPLRRSSFWTLNTWATHEMRAHMLYKIVSARNCDTSNSTCRVFSTIHWERKKNEKRTIELSSTHITASNTILKTIDSKSIITANSTNMYQKIRKFHYFSPVFYSKRNHLSNPL